MMQRIWVILSKEVIDNLRDRRAWSMALVSVLIGPLMMSAVIRQVSRVSSDESTQVLELPVEGAERAPGLIDYLNQHNVQVKPAPGDPEAAVRASDADVVLIIPAGYQEDFQAGRPATVRLVVDESRTQTNGTIRRVRDNLRKYSSAVGMLRLMARGVSPSTASALAIENDDLATPESSAEFVFSLVPMFLMMALFSGGMYVAIDTTTGERERGSLEPLLVNPVSSAELVLGKLGATLLFATVTTLLTAGGFALSLNNTPLDMPGMRIGMSLPIFFQLMLILVPVMIAVSSAQMIVATRSRNFKEAQTSAQFMMMLPMLPGMLMVFSAVKPPPWAMSVPIVGQELLMRVVLRGESIKLLELALASTSSLLLGLVLVLLTIRRYDRQRVLFGR